MIFRLAHSRKMIIKRLIALQVLLVVIVFVAYMFLSYPEGHSALSTGVISVFILFFSGVYFLFSALCFSKIADPLFFELKSNGEAIWVPFFAKRILRFQPHTTAEVENGRLSFSSPPEGQGVGLHKEQIFLVPKTVCQVI